MNSKYQSQQYLAKIQLYNITLDSSRHVQGQNTDTRPTLHDYEIGQRDWGHVDWKVNTVISFENEALPFPPGLIFFMYE